MSAAAGARPQPLAITAARAWLETSGQSLPSRRWPSIHSVSRSFPEAPSGKCARMISTSPEIAYRPPARDEKAADLDGDEASAHVLLSWVHEAEHRSDLAETAIGRAVELNPGDLDVRAERGAIYLDQDRLDEAIHEFETVLSFDPISDPTWEDLGTAYYFAGRLKDAVAILEQNLGRKPDRVSAWVVLAATYADMKLEPQARNAAVRVLRLSPFFAAKHFTATFAQPSQRERLAAGLHRAGLP
jgi:tetratricopeptide (TPR) repeat protein